MQTQILTPASPVNTQMTNDAKAAASIMFHTTVEGERPACARSQETMDSGR